MAHQLTQADRVKGGLRSQEVQRVAREKLLRQRGELYQWLEVYEREDIQAFALVEIVGLGQAILAGGIPAAESPRDVVAYIDAQQRAHKVLRLELGESTSNAASINVDGERLTELLHQRAAMLAESPDTPT